jgi:hypothetical protein
LTGGKIGSIKRKFFIFLFSVCFLFAIFSSANNKIPRLKKYLEGGRHLPPCHPPSYAYAEKPEEATDLVMKTK